jgi:hypothetical protein
MTKEERWNIYYCIYDHLPEEAMDQPRGQWKLMLDKMDDAQLVAFHETVKAKAPRCVGRRRSW